MAGGALTISDGDRRIAATVVLDPFFDPNGEVVRS